MRTQLAGNCRFAPDRLAGLVFLSATDWCFCRSDSGFVYDAPLSKERSYAITDPESNEFLGVLRPGIFVGDTEMSRYRVFLLRPLFEVEKRDGM